MDGWPEEWFRKAAASRIGGAGDRGPGPGPGPGRTEGDPTVQVPYRNAGNQAAAAPPPGTAWPGQVKGQGQGQGQGGTAWPDQPPPRSSGVRASRASGGGTRRRGRRVLKIIAGVLVVLLAATAGMYCYLDARLHRAAVLAHYSGRP